MDATRLAIAAQLRLWPAPWTVRHHPEPADRQHPWLWNCTTTDCDTAGTGVNESDAHQQAAEHHIRDHTSQ